MPTKTLLIFLFAIAFLLRLLLVPNPGFEADVSFWKSWGLATADYGIVEGIKLTNNNYPTPFAYTLGLMVKLYSIFKDPHNFNEFWQNTNLTFLAVSKAFPILADLGIAALILYIGRNASTLGFPVLSLSFYELLTMFYLFNPVSLIDGAWWGQVDSLGVFTFLLALLALLKRKPFLAGFVFMLSMMTKLQTMIYGPLFFLFVWQLTGYQGAVKALAGAAVGFFGLNIEFFLSRNMDRVIESLTTNFDYFPYLSLNAFNLWWIVSGGHGMAVSDKIAALGITNAKTVGFLLFSSFYLFAMLKQLIATLLHGYIDKKQGSKTMKQFNNVTMEDVQYKKNLLRIFIESLIIVNAAFFLFQTQSHDRYAFPLIVFLILWAPFYLSLGSKHQALSSRFKVFALFYVLFTMLYFYNLHTALVFNYPTNGAPLLSLFTSPIITMGASFGFLALYFFFLWQSETKALLLIPAALFLLLVGAKNMPLLTKKPVSLTTITPFISTQDFGSRQTNKSVNSSFGISSWNRLSVQYAFYRKGIGTHANSHHIFDINRKFRTFRADYGLDTESGLKASAVFEIYGDNKLLFRSEKMGKFDMPRHAEINVSGIKYLALVTTDAGDGNTDDHTDWLRPTLWP